MKSRRVFIRTILLILIISGVVLTLVVFGVSAEKFPSREIIIVVNYSAGGPIDLTTRVLAEYLKKELGVPVVVDNRAEAGGVKGVVDVYKAKPDGYTLLANLLPRTAQMEIAYNPPFKILELTYLAAFQKQEALVAAGRDSPYKTLKDLVDASKKKPLNCSVAGMGSRSHLNAMILKMKVGVNLEVVPFKGSAPAMMALLGGNVDLITVDDLTVLLHKEKVRSLAIFSEKRSRNFPDIPTLKELGYDIPLPDAATGICGPPGLLEGVRKILSDALAKAIKNPELISKVEKMGPTAIYMSGPEFKAVAESSYKLVEEYKDILLEKK